MAWLTSVLNRLRIETYKHKIILNAYVLSDNIEHIFPLELFWKKKRKEKEPNRTRSKFSGIGVILNHNLGAIPGDEISLYSKLCNEISRARLASISQRS
jgi:hypothetical protein